MVDCEKNKFKRTRNFIIILLKIIRKFKSKMDCGVIISAICLIIVYSKPAFKYRLYDFLNKRASVSMVAIEKLLFYIEHLSCIVILLWLVLMIIHLLGGIIWDYQIRKIKGDSRFEQCALRYMQDKGIPHCLLITGDWGSGKTHDVNEFIQKYYYNSSINVYRVSCFGLCTRKEVVEEINDTIKRMDNSINKSLSIAVRYIPIMGEPLSKLLSRTYRYDSVKKGSIFIFDDFERITSRTSTDTKLPILYKKNSFLRSELRETTFTKLSTIDDEFRQIERAFNRLREENEYVIDRNDCDKYISIAGLINELIETYKMKVFVICNTDVFGGKFVHDVLRSKLNCVEYKKVPSAVIRTSVIKRIISNTMFEDVSKQRIVKDYSKRVLQEWENGAYEPYFSNLRLFGGLFEALINEIVLIDSRLLSEDLLDSLFKSILLTHIFYYEDNLSVLERFENGMNITFLLRLYDHKRISKSLEEECSNARWVDITISGHWILNLSKPNNINGILNQWNAYEFAELEKHLNYDYRYIERAEECNLLHVLYTMEIHGNSVGWDYETAIRKALKEHDLSKIDEIQEILDVSNEVLRTVNNDFYDTLFEELQKGGAVGEIVGDNYIYRRYREYVKKDNE